MHSEDDQKVALHSQFPEKNKCKCESGWSVNASLFMVFNIYFLLC